MPHRLSLTPFEDEDDLLDALECVQEMRRNNGELDLPPTPDQIWSPRRARGHYRAVESFVADLRRFGYIVAVTRESYTGHPIRVRLLEQ